jgi:class 3 adenylate cyclase
MLPGSEERCGRCQLTQTYQAAQPSVRETRDSSIRECPGTPNTGGRPRCGVASGVLVGRAAVVVSGLWSGAGRHGRVSRRLPTGTVTFLLSDAEASSALWQRDVAAADAAFAHLDVVVDDAVSGAGGVLLKARGEGDSHFAVFNKASAAVAAAVTLQRTVASTRWPFDVAISVRVAVHTGEPLVRDGDYLGPVVNETARLRSLGHGGQVLVSPVTAMLARACLDDDVRFLSLGVFRIRDFAQPQEVFQVIAPDMEREFAPLNALDSIPPPIAAVVRLDVSGSRRLLDTAGLNGMTESLRRFARVVRANFDACRGYTLHISGDSVSAAFATPVLAVEFVRQLQSRVQRRGFAIRAGLHAGELEVTTGGPVGVALIVADGLLRVALPGEIVTTATIAELLH